MSGCIQCWKKLIKIQGDRIGLPCGRVTYAIQSVPLILSVMAPDPFDSAIAKALVRSHSDNPLCHHSNGVENKARSCPSHTNDCLVKLLETCKDTGSRVAAPPLGLRVFLEK